MVIYICFRAFFGLNIQTFFLNLISHGAKLPRQEHGMRKYLLGRLRLFQIQTEERNGQNGIEPRNPRIINIISMHRSIITIRSNTRLLECLPRVPFPIIIRKGCHRPRITPEGVLPLLSRPSAVFLLTFGKILLKLLQQFSPPLSPSSSFDPIRRANRFP